MSTTQTSLGEEFARAFGARDRDGVRRLVSPDVDFKALTPTRNDWDAQGADALLEILFDVWIKDDEMRAIEKVEHEVFEDRERVGYRFRVGNQKGEYLVEQQAYLTEEAGRITWIRLVCSGWRRLHKDDAE